MNQSVHIQTADSIILLLLLLRAITNRTMFALFTFGEKDSIGAQDTCVPGPVQSSWRVIVVDQKKPAVPIT